jgi:hypothetical protein
VGQEPSGKFERLCRDSWVSVGHGGGEHGHVASPPQVPVGTISATPRAKGSNVLREARRRGIPVDPSARFCMNSDRWEASGCLPEAIYELRG